MLCSPLGPSSLTREVHSFFCTCHRLCKARHGQGKACSWLHIEDICHVPFLIISSWQEPLLPSSQLQAEAQWPSTNKCTSLFLPRSICRGGVQTSLVLLCAVQKQQLLMANAIILQGFSLAPQSEDLRKSGDRGCEKPETHLPVF